MKHCPVEAFRFPDEVSTCPICGRALVDASVLDDLPDDLRRVMATSCCPNPGCQNNIAPPKTNFCPICGVTLAPISYDVWVSKFVEPALDQSLAAVLLNPTELFRPIIEMGLSRSHARTILEPLIKERMGVDLTVGAEWIKQAAQLLEEQEGNFDSELLIEQAAELGIYPATARELVNHLTGEDGVTDSDSAAAEPLPPTTSTPDRNGTERAASDSLLDGEEQQSVPSVLSSTRFVPLAKVSRSGSWRYTALLILLLTIPAVVAMSFLIPKATENSLDQNGRSSPTPSPVPAGMAYISGGTFMMGSDDGDEFERPRHRVTVPAFYIDIHEVTNEEYAQFVKALNVKPPQSWNGNNPPSHLAKLPVTGIEWYDANFYAQWKKKRLPTEEEWELAARTQNSQKYPWGNEWQSNAANAGKSSARGLVPVGSYPLGASPQGVTDLIGNAWEWTASDLKAYPGGKLSAQKKVTYKVIRGGSWREDATEATGSYRGYLRASGARDYSATGFRCVKDIIPSN